MTLFERARGRRVGRLVAVPAASLTAAVVLSACGSTSGTTTTLVAPTTAAGRVATATCPLRGTPAPGGIVPRRPALAIKVDNYSFGPPPAEARPQSGLDYADIVFEEQVEGSITRYAAVFQCANAPSLVGPVRSARWTDIQMLSQLGHPILVHVGGINPVLTLINRSALVNVDLGYHAGIEQNPRGRYSPYDDYTTTRAVWALERTMTTPPAPIFTYSPVVPDAPRVSQVHLPWSGTSDIFWRWDPAAGTWKRYYGEASGAVTVIVPDVLADGVQNQVQNVVVEQVSITYGPWFENSQGGKEAESHLFSSSGTAYVFRNGRMTVGTWSASANGVTTLKSRAGRVLTLEPGRTWVEIYPNVAHVEVSLVASPTTTTTPGG